MSSPANPFTSMVPGFDFLQGLVKNAGAAMPGMNRWIAPTLDPEELDKNINDLKTVLFWLEQNVRMVSTTIQALEVQRMTLSTLKTMNVSFGDLTEALKIRMPDQAAQAAAPAPPPPAPAPSPAPAPAPAAAVAHEAPATGTPTVPPGVIDPMQWWGALTQQFGQIAASALHDSAPDGRPMAGAARKAAAKAPVKAAAKTARKPAAKPRAAARAGKAR